MNKLFLGFFYSIISIFSGFAQSTSYNIIIPWGKSLEINHNDTKYFLPSIDGGGFQGQLPYYSWSEKVNGLTTFDFSFSNFQYEELSFSESQLFIKERIEVSKEPRIGGKTVSDRGVYFATVGVVPLVYLNGKYLKLKSFDLKIVPKSASFKSKSFVAHSVLSDLSSAWYKIAVTTDGIYKIDKAQLSAMGIDVANLNPQHINIYGNANGRLPIDNAIYRPDDLAKNAIQIVGEQDGVFNDEDYILFHAYGPNKWSKKGNKFQNEMNPYSTSACYFIRISTTEPPLRIQNYTSNPSSTIVVTDYDYATVYEKELHNLVHGGSRWYGDLFDVELSRNYSFNIPNLITSVPVDFGISFASNSSSASNTFTTKLNGTTINTADCGVTGELKNYIRVQSLFSAPSASGNLQLGLTFNRVTASTELYLDRIEINARRGLVQTGNQMYFRDLNSVGNGNVANFKLSGVSSNYEVWDVTNRCIPTRIEGSLIGSEFNFSMGTDTLREFVSFAKGTYLTPTFVKVVSPQDLHGLEPAKLLIVTHPDFRQQAERLANLHRAQNTSTHVVTTEQVYNEFSSGVQDPVAIRWFAKMFYDRAGSDVTKMPENLLLFGTGNYDPKAITVQGNFVVTYQVENSENHINALVADDFFGILDDVESFDTTDKLDIGVGRLIASDQTTAKDIVDKIQSYITNSMLDTSEDTFEDWRLKYVLIADDETYFLTQDCEPNSNFVTVNHPEMNCEKLYADAHTQVTSAGGQRYPSLVEGINQAVEKGALVINYVGHGGINGAADERFITIPQIQSWSNLDRLNLFVSATCEFTLFDDPAQLSAGEWNFLNPNGGCIATLTTTRSIYYNVNTTLGQNFFQNVFKRDGNLEPLTLGEIARRTKNGSTDGENKRCFMLIGDPALKLALPRLKVVTDSINGLSPTIEIDTVRALSKMRIRGHIEDQMGNVMTSYNGVLTPSIYDKPKNNQTLNNKPGKTSVVNYQTQQNVVYRGNVSIKNGYFDFSFIVPKDIDYNYAEGKISYYAENNNIDAGGSDKRFLIGGVDPNGVVDNTPPIINMYLNDETFVSGGLTDENPKLIVKLYDDNGINSVGNGIGHDIVAILDEKSDKPVILNNYYIADLDSYQKGKVEYDFSKIPVGKHTLTFKVWDVNNNSAEAKLNFEVVEKKELALSHVLNYPNPFTTHTEFYFEHNQVLEPLETQVQIFTVSGKLVRTINQLVTTNGFRSEGIAWDGRDDFGDNIGKGVYIYQLSVKNSRGETAKKTEKLVILK